MSSSRLFSALLCFVNISFNNLNFNKVYTVVLSLFGFSGGHLNIVKGPLTKWGFGKMVKNVN